LDPNEECAAWLTLLATGEGHPPHRLVVVGQRHLLEAHWAGFIGQFDPDKVLG